MMKAVPEPKKRFQVNLRSIMSAGEAVGVTVDRVGQAQLGVTINEMFRQTEINYVVATSRRPGGEARIVGRLTRGIGSPSSITKVWSSQGELGEIAVKKRS